MHDANQLDRQAMLSDAMEKLRAALQLLDSATAPPHIGAHVDLAVHQLYGEIARKTADGRLVQIDLNAELQ
jgi:hypothetical protein